MLEGEINEGLSFLDIPVSEETSSNIPSPSASISHPTDGRRNPDGARQYEITEFHQRHRDIARLAVLGITNVKIAEELDCTPQTVSNTLNSSIVRRHVERLQGLRDQNVIDSGSRLAELTPMAVEEIRKGFNKESGLSANQRLKSAQDILDRNGHGRTSKVYQEVVHAHMTLEDISEITELANRQAKSAGIVSVNAEVV